MTRTIIGLLVYCVIRVFQYLPYPIDLVTLDFYDFDTGSDFLYFRRYGKPFASAYLYTLSKICSRHIKEDKGLPLNR